MAPDAVVLGYLMLVLPALVLLGGATAFFWMLLFAPAALLARRWLGRGAALAVAGVVTLGAAYVLPMLSENAGARAVAAAVAEGQRADAPRVALSGAVMLAAPDPAGDRSCGALCLALLGTPGVTSVTVPALPAIADRVPARPQQSFALAARPACASDPRLVTLTDPRTIRLNWPAGDEMRSSGGGLAANLAQAAEWTIRLGDRQCVISVDVPAVHAFTIAETRTGQGRDLGAPLDAPWSLGHAEPAGEWLEIRDRNGAVVLRRGTAGAWVLARPLHVALLSSTPAQTGWSREWVGAGEENGRLSIEQTLADGTNLYRGMVPAQLPGLIRTRMLQALDNPGAPASDIGFAMAGPWLANFERAPRVSADDRLLIARLIADRRVTRLRYIDLPIRAMGTDAEALRPALTARLAQQSPGDDAYGGLDLALRVMEPRQRP
jgi:hypothetical protein